MGHRLLDHLWDDTIAGPPPDSAHSHPSALKASAAAPRVTRSITIARPSSGLADSISSAPSSPASAPASPSTPGTPREDWRSFRRRNPSSSSAAVAEPRSPTVYDWVVISALDR